ncbi:pectate lyase superfamily protein [Vibrio phage 2.275.O._10N.286.54.E11]|nr:pectate lyase superfamily protein [Vibrio phage 2.275.O._10N.286.54.E11]
MGSLSNYFGGVAGSATAVKHQTLETLWGLPPGSVQVWQAGATVTSPEQIRVYTDGIAWYAPDASPTNPITQPENPALDDKWIVKSSDVNSPVLATFIGDGTTMNFTVPNSSGAYTETVDVSIDGISQTPSVDFIFAQEVLTFIGEAPPYLSEISVKILLPNVAGQDTGVTPLTQDTIIADGTQTVFSTPSTRITNPANLMVWAGGIRQRPGMDYNVNNSGDIVFNEAPYELAEIDVMWFAPRNIDETDVTSSTALANGSTVQRTLGDRFSDVVNVKDFGAVGDGVTDDADAFQRAVDSDLGNTIYVPDGHVFIIGSEVDLRFKNLVGMGGISQSTSANGVSEIAHPVGYTGVMFSYPGGTVRDIYFRGNAGTATCFNRIGYNQRFQDCTFRVFNTALHSIGGTAGATVNFYIDRCNFYSNTRCFFSEDVNSNDSTTTHISNCEFNNNNECIIFDKNAYGCSFTNLIFEYCNVPLKAKAFASCTFDTHWYEYTLDGSTRDIITTNSQLFQRNVVTSLYIHPSSTWDNNITSDGTSAGGVFTDRDVLRVGGFQGDRVKVQDRYLQDDFNSAFGGTTDRQFGIKGSDQHPVSGLNTTVRVDHGSGGRVVFGHTDETRTTKTTQRRAIGPNSTGDAAYLGLDEWDANIERSWEAYDPNGTTPTGKFRALMYFQYRNTGTPVLEQSGYVLSKIGTGHWRLTRETSVPDFSSPLIVVSGIVSSDFLLHRIGSITASSFDIFFADTSSVAVDPDRFTLGFQSIL